MSLSLADRMDLAPGIPAKRLVHEAPWLVAALAETADSRERLRRWFAGGGLDRPAPDVDQALAFFGDVEVRPAVVAAIKAVPAPVRSYVLAAVTVLAVGASSFGWTGASPPTRPRLVVLDGSRRDALAIARTALHEFAHTWCEPEPASIHPPCDWQEVRRLAVTEGWSEQFDRLRREAGENTEMIERRARTLTATWARKLQLKQ